MELGRVELACLCEPDESAVGRALATGAFSSSKAHPPLTRNSPPSIIPSPLRSARRCRNPVLATMAGLLSPPNPSSLPGSMTLTTAEAPGPEGSIQPF